MWPMSRYDVQVFMAYNENDAWRRRKATEKAAYQAAMKAAEEAEAHGDYRAAERLLDIAMDKLAVYNGK